jgi:lysophospholipase L1-like esterase
MSGCDLSGWPFDGGGLLLAADPGPPAPAPPRPPRVVVFGDSYSDGRRPETGEHGWVRLVARELGIETVNNAVSGCGYVDLGQGVTLPYMVTTATAPDPDLVVVFGSINDRPQSPVAVWLAAVVTFAAVRAWAPDAPLLVIGPQYPTGYVTDVMWALRGAVMEAATDAGATFVDPLTEQWFADRPDLIGSDGLHPNSRGHAYLADLIGPRIAAALTPEAP